MKVVEIVYNINEYGYNHIQSWELKSDNNRMSMYDMTDCPEDANFNRDLSQVFNVIDFIKEAYEAGKNGEPLKIEYIEDSNE